MKDKDLIGMPIAIIFQGPASLFGWNCSLIEVNVNRAWLLCDNIFFLYLIMLAWSLALLPWYTYYCWCSPFRHAPHCARSVFDLVHCFTQELNIKHLPALVEPPSWRVGRFIDTFSIPLLNGLCQITEFKQYWWYKEHSFQTQRIWVSFKNAAE